MDSSPMVAITGQVITPLIGTDAFQETDITGITMPITKHSYLVTDVEEIPTVMKEAFYIARSGRPGPVLVDIAKDAQAATLEYVYPDEVNLPGYQVPDSDLSAEIKELARLIDKADRPLLIAGHGVVLAGAEDALLQLVERGQVPVITTLLGIGSMPEMHPLCLGMAGMHGEAYTNLAITEADLIVSLGSRFDDRLTGPVKDFGKQAHIVHVDIDPVEIGKTVWPDLALVGDLMEILPALVPLIDNGGDAEARRQGRARWLARIQEWRGESAKRDIVEQETDEMVPQYVMR
jgi:acetolactate synthase-1/2/3 large subunit